MLNWVSPMSGEWLVERLQTTHTLCEIGLFLKEQGKDAWLPTVLELLLYYAQVLVDENCVVE